MRKWMIRVICCLAVSSLLCPSIAIAASAAKFIVQGVAISHLSVDAGENGGCWVYANEIYEKIWGRPFSNSFTDSRNSLRNLSDEQRTITAEHTKAFIQAAQVGAVIRISNAPSSDSHFDNDDAAYSGHTCYLDNGKPKYGHSMILVEKTDSDFTVIQSSGGTSSEKTFTWAQFENEYAPKYVYFKYILWEESGKSHE